MNPTPPPTRYVIGCMTGTSLDALDAVLTRIAGSGLEMTAEFLAHHSVDIPEALRQPLRAMAAGQAHQPIDFLRTARHLGVFHAQVCGELIARHPGVTVDFVTPHGQTIWHAPSDAVSWQLFDPWPMVRALGVPVCYDLRQADLVAGGEGAPITPIADWVMYRREADVVINLGGVHNLTLLDEDLEKVSGRDAGPCNLMLDGLCEALFAQRYDDGGRHALSGSVVAEMVGEIQQAVDRHARSGSLGREQYSLSWASALAEACQAHGSPVDVLRSASQVVAQRIAADPLKHGCKRWVIGGGGFRNEALMRALRDAAGDAAVRLSDELGIPAEAREGMGFAVLGALSQDGVPITLPKVTGSTSPGVAGVWAAPPVSTDSPKPL